MPEKFHQYDLTETLSKKYSHATYLASPTNPQRGYGEPERQVVLTVFASSLFRFPHERESLLQKAQRIKQLRHPHLIPILDIGVEEEQPFIVRKYLPNSSLRSHLKQLFPHGLELRDALTIVSQVGEALAYAHEHSIVHGNIKAENILFDGNGHAVLADFNLVSRKDAVIRDQTSEEYAFCYLAPEQFAGTCDARSDQYALGCLTYELITGRVPFAAQSLASMMGQPNNALPAPLSESVADLPPSLEAAVLKTLAKDPDERFFDFSLFLEVIKSVLSPPPAFPLAHSTPSRKNRTIPRSVRSVRARGVSSPTRNRTPPPNSVPQPSEVSGATSSAEIDAAELVSTSSMFQANMPEWTGILPLSEPLASALQSYRFPFSLPGEVYSIDDRENEEEADDLLITDSFVQEEENALPVIASMQGEIQEEEDIPPVIASTSLNHENSEDAAAEETLLLTRSSDVGGPSSVRPLYSKRRVVGLALLLSVIIGLIVYISLPLGMATHDTSLYMVNKKVIVPQIESISTPEVPTQFSPIPTAQPPVAAAPTTQPAMPVRNSPPVRPPASAPAPTPTPAPIVVGPTSYEAESSQNTIANGAQVISCSSCSGGYRVGYLGNQPNGKSGTLQFNNVNKISAGTYTLTLYYSNGATSNQDEYISVNGGSAIVFSGSPTGSFSTFTTAGIAVSLNGGKNTIEFYNPQSSAPDIDKIVV